MPDDVVVRLTKSQALVLFEWMSNADSWPRTTFDHPAEESAVWVVLGQLESALTEPLAPNYKVLLNEARAQVVKK
jgi:hypothetical protein